MEELHRTLLEVGFAAGADLGLVLAGGYALTEHGLLEHASRDIDFATATTLPLPVVASRLATAYHDAGYAARIVETTARMARLLVSTGSAECEVDILKEAIGPPAQLRVGPVLAIDDAVGLKLRALHERAAHRDYVDVHAASSRYAWSELEALGARHTSGFSLVELAERLAGIGELVGDGFDRYGLDEAAVSELLRWAIAWEADIRARLAAGETGPAARADDGEWDAYLDPPG